MSGFEQVYRAFFHPGEVTEIRVLGVKQRTAPAWDGGCFAGVVYGYFNNAEAFGKAAEALSKLSPPPKGIYFTPNPCKPELLARAANRLVGGGKDATLTSDHDIALIRWLLVDLDPKRPSGISSDQTELDRARELGRELAGFMDSVGFAPPLKALSGNGYHANFRLADLPNEPEISGRQKGLIAKSLAALADRFRGLGVDVDVTVGNAARIWKLYGTLACKGDHTKDRPHRKSRLYDAPESLDLVPVTPREILEKLAGMAPPEPGKGQQRPAPVPAKTKSLPQDGNLGPLDVERYLARYGFPVKGTRVDGASTFYMLENCIFDPTHTDGKAAIISGPNPPYLTYACFHQSCKGRTWKDARRVISGDASVAEFCEGYDPNWKKPAKRTRNEAAKGEPTETEQEAVNMALYAQFVEFDSEALVQRVNWDAFLDLNPDRLPPLVFFDLGPEGKRKRGSFVESRMAEYLHRYFDPIRCTDGKFYRFIGGWWQVVNEDVVKNVVYRALKDLCKSNHLDAALALLKAKANKPEDDWTAWPHLVNCQNGMVDLSIEFLDYKYETLCEDGGPVSDKLLLPHSPEYDSRVQLPVDYDPLAKCPRWMQFLEEIFPGSRGKQNLLQMFAGYCLIPKNLYEKALFMYGTGANGKSTVISVLEKILGLRNVCSVSLSELARPFSVLRLQNKLLNVASEMETKETQSTETLKKVISGDTVTGEEKFGRTVDFKPYVTLMFAMNNPPSVTDKTDGFRRKILVLNFDQRIPDEKMDRRLVDKLVSQEAPGIFAWMVHGAYMLQLQGGFTDLGDEVERDTESFMHTLNPLLDFLEEHTEFAPDARVPSDDLYKAYRQWCEDGGLRPLGKVQFGIQLTSSPKVVKKKCDVADGALVSRRNCFVGIKLR